MTTVLKFGAGAALALWVKRDQLVAHALRREPPKKPCPCTRMEEPCPEGNLHEIQELEINDGLDLFPDDPLEDPPGMDQIVDRMHRLSLGNWYDNWDQLNHSIIDKRFKHLVMIVSPCQYDASGGKLTPKGRSMANLTILRIQELLDTMTIPSFAEYANLNVFVGCEPKCKILAEELVDMLESDFKIDADKPQLNNVIPDEPSPYPDPNAKDPVPVISVASQPGLDLFIHEEIERPRMPSGGVSIPRKGDLIFNVSVIVCRSHMHRYLVLRIMQQKTQWWSRLGRRHSDGAITMLEIDGRGYVQLLMYAHRFQDAEILKTKSFIEEPCRRAKSRSPPPIEHGLSPKRPRI